MAKSRSESPVPSAMPSLSLRGAEGDVAISMVRQGEDNSAWPGQRIPYCIPRPLGERI
jgi:hypothetical protein